MLKYLLILTSTILILLIITIYWHTYNLISSKDVFSTIPLKRYLFSEEEKNIKSGDLLYSRNSISTFQEWVSPFVYKHVSIVVEFGDKLYVAEAIRPGIICRIKDKLASRDGGVIIRPLKMWLTYVLGPVFLFKLNKPLSNVKYDKLQNTIIDLYGTCYPNAMYMYLSFIWNFPIKKLIYCHTLILNCLINMDLIPNTYIKKNAMEIGNIISNIDNIDLRDGYKYHHPKMLIFDDRCDNELF